MISLKSPMQLKINILNCYCPNLAKKKCLTVGI